jgi:hypothetical protein
MKKILYFSINFCLSLFFISLLFLFSEFNLTNTWAEYQTQNNSENIIKANTIQLIDNDGNEICQLDVNKTLCSLENNRGSIMFDSANGDITLNNVQANDKILYTPLGTLNLIYKGNNFLKAINATPTNYLTFIGDKTDNLTINSITVEQGTSTRGAINTNGNIKFLNGNINLKSQNTPIKALGTVLIEGSIKMIATTSKDWSIESTHIAINLDTGGDIQLYGGIKSGNLATDSEFCLSKDSILNISASTLKIQSNNSEQIYSNICLGTISSQNKGDLIHIYYQVPVENIVINYFPFEIIFFILGCLIIIILLIIIIKQHHNPSLLIPFKKTDDEYSKKVIEYLYNNGRKYSHILTDSSWKIAIENARLVEINRNLIESFDNILQKDKIKKVIVYPENDNLKTIKNLNDLETINKIKFKLLEL